MKVAKEKKVKKERERGRDEIKLVHMSNKLISDLMKLAIFNFLLQGENFRFLIEFFLRQKNQLTVSLPKG